jgi:superfamily II DNA helicase RecQ
MQLKMFTIPIKNVIEAESEMNGFLRGHRVLAVKKEFVADGENSFWSFCVEYLDGAAVASTGGMASGTRPPKVDYREILTPEEFELFSRLRDWRKVAAEKEGVPVYAVLTNGQLAQVVQKKITTNAGLKEIDGVGDARMDKYGEALLRQLGVPEGPPTS